MAVLSKISTVAHVACCPTWGAEVMRGLIDLAWLANDGPFLPVGSYHILFCGLAVLWAWIGCHVHKVENPKKALHRDTNMCAGSRYMMYTGSKRRLGLISMRSVHYAKHEGPFICAALRGEGELTLGSKRVPEAPEEHVYTWRIRAGM